MSLLGLMNPLSISCDDVADLSIHLKLLVSHMLIELMELFSNKGVRSRALRCFKRSKRDAPSSRRWSLLLNILGGAASEARL